MFVPLIKRYQSLNIPTVHDGNISRPSENHQDLQQKTKTMLSQMSFPGITSSLQVTKRGGLSKVDSLLKKSLLLKGANVTFPQQYANEGNGGQNGKHGTKRLRTMETKLARSISKRQRTNSSVNMIVELSGLPLEKAELPRNCKRRLSSAAEQSISSKRRKLKIVKDESYSSMKDISYLIKQYEGLNVPSACPKMEE